MALAKHYHSMKPSDKIRAQQEVYREQHKMFTMGSEKPVYFPGRTQKFLWKPPVQRRSDLPLRPATMEARFVLDEDAAYFWLDGRWQQMIIQQGLEVTPKLAAAEAEEPAMTGRQVGKSHPLTQQIVGKIMTDLLDQKLQPEKILMDRQAFDDLLNWFGEPESEPDMELLIGGPIKIPDWALPASVREEHYGVPFFKISRENFEKTEQELLAYPMPITRIIEDNSLKDIQAIEDKDFMQHVRKAAYFGVLELIPGEWATPPPEFDNIFDKKPDNPFDDLFKEDEE